VDDKKLAGDLTAIRLYDNQVESHKSLNLADFPKGEALVETSFEPTVVFPTDDVYPSIWLTSLIRRNLWIAAIF
jgi:hypothetical protein